MPKRYLTLLLFFLYVALLFILSVRFDDRDRQLASGRFFSGFGESLSLLIRYTAFAIVTSSAFLICVNYFKTGSSLSFTLSAPLFFIGVAFIVGLIISFFLWISRLENDISIFQKLFLISTITTALITLWLFGNLITKKKKILDS